MSKIIIEIKCDGSAFFAGESFRPDFELENILQNIIKRGIWRDRILLDTNGNNVGNVSIEED